MPKTSNTILRGYSPGTSITYDFAFHSLPVLLLIPPRSLNSAIIFPLNSIFCCVFYDFACKDTNKIVECRMKNEELFV